MKKYILVFVMSLTCYSMKAQVGIGTSNPNSASVLELRSKTKGFLPPRLTTAERNAIVSPTAGLIIYNSTKNCLEWYNGTVWYNGCGNQDGEPSSGGSAVVSAYSCSTASNGTIKKGVAVSGVTQTITATVNTIGTYNISTTANGVTFSGSGTFSATGAQDIVLTATGTLTAEDTTTFTLNTDPNCSFSRGTADNSTGGTAIVSSYSCEKGDGTLELGSEVSEVTQTITAMVDKIGTYAISATANGVTFSGSGTFSGTGSQNIVLTAAGTLTVAGSTSYVLNTTPNCSFIRSTENSTSGGTAIVSVYDCRELYSPEDKSYGYLVQGLKAEAFQVITATVTAVGTYNISTTTVNGVTYSGSGYLYSTGENRISLKPNGISANSGSHSFTLKTTPNCSFNKDVISSSSFTLAICDGSAPTTVVPITTATGKTWMDRNLGASRQAVGQYDHKAYGCMYQWGRGNDGHASMKWYTPISYLTPINGSTVSLSTNDIPGHSLFISTSNTYPYDWRLNGNPDLWQGINGINNPCPTGYRIPTFDEFNEEMKKGSFKNNPLKFAGRYNRRGDNGGFEMADTAYYTSNIFYDTVSYFNDKSLDVETNQVSKSTGMFVRCIKD
jgi:hypothetical protein